MEESRTGDARRHHLNGVNSQAKQTQPIHSTFIYFARA